ncbi:SDR family NAD(P)-dependent oxidoreductase [Mycolicibacterium sp. 018/SC-01/001]|uniref:SDR family NAD(P)-dependent oxidoreductase n=1 Tax=Mycolicibacterium sp. 018/SC-01/001 TaxID=2592069 RepID=UPI00117BF63C|nr:SDR family NAD(P)-dependent oxidoreductase [Mycolicibacterium sp. 018/SC-01/001]TRW78748.1 SDR family NAD(P)-dependent oxidoreductase [Mycolicibacterium sp. 018/SC-01/001]
MTSTPTALQIVDGVDLSGRTIVITGATSGLGRESARCLAHTGARVILTGRDDPALAETRAWVHDQVPGAETATVRMDLASLESVSDAAAQIMDLTPAVHVLMNNAGVMFTPLRRTVDGFEMQFGTNYLGHFELTRCLLPALVAADGARVVNLSSAGHRLGDIDLDDPNWELRDYDKFAAYGASKTANVLHAVETDRRLRDSGVRAYAVHPGIVATALARHMDEQDFADLDRRGRTNRQFTTPEYGAATQVWAAVSDEVVEAGSVYLADCAVGDVESYAVDEARALTLWDLSERLCTAVVSAR